MSSKKKRSQKKARRTVRQPVNISPKTDGQKAYLGLIESCDITICDGVAGTGKTLLAVGMALQLMYEHRDIYRKIVMVRPAVTVRDEEIGYLPGSIDDKMAPFIAPMMDSMTAFLDVGAIQSLADGGIIDVIPISYMRGRTFNNSILIFDEAQNSTPRQMKMFLTRIGFNTKAIIEGDVSQSDLQGDYEKKNGLYDIIHRFSNPILDGIGIAKLEGKDVVRSPIVKKILTRYDN